MVVTYGDVPLLTPEVLQRLVAHHEERGNAVTVLTADHEQPGGYGRILRGEDGTVTGIREHKDASDAERLIRRGIVEQSLTLGFAPIDEEQDAAREEDPADEEIDTPEDEADAIV